MIHPVYATVFLIHTAFSNNEDIPAIILIINNCCSRYSVSMFE